MGELFLFNIAGKVLEKVGSPALQEIALAWGVKSELNKLDDTLSTVKAVLLDAEEQQSKNQQLKVWLEKLKDCCYDAEDVLDEFEYKALWQQVVNNGGIKRKVRNSFSRSNPLAFRLKMGHKIKSIREKLDGIAADKNKFNLAERVEDRLVVHVVRETHSSVQGLDFIGRDDDKENIIKRLMCVRANDQENVNVIPVVGIGGLGKTTLAKFVYNDERIVGYFQLKMWVYVSNDFDVKKLIKEIICCATGSTCDDLSMEQMQTRLQDNLRNKHFLLILDDVWNDDPVKWNELKDLLTGGAKGSKILVTTRIQLFDSIMSTDPMYGLKGLSEKDCMSLFVKWTFGKGKEEQYSNLVEIGKEIVKKCKGVPLAVRTLGSLLHLNSNARYWSTVNNSEIWKLEQKQNDILPALKLSYNAIPSSLKQCFAFCSIFPKDYEFTSVELIPLWMAHALLQSSNENLDLEYIGQQYIRDLWQRSFIQDVVDDGFVIKFKMHHLIHELALSVGQSEYSVINSHTQYIDKRVRHLSFCEKDWSLDEVPTFLFQNDNVRTMLFQVRGVGSSSQSFVETCISKFKCLRVLDLSARDLEVLPNSISKLKHLRYLDLSWNFRIKKLPNSIFKLQNLEALGLLGCSGLEELPRGIGKLTKLRCLQITTKQMILPKEEIRSLTSLQNLLIGACERLKSLGEVMECLTTLRTLVIGACPSLEEFLPCSMKYLSALETLDISGCGKLNLMEREEDIQSLKLSLRSFGIGYLPLLLALPQWLRGAINTLQHLRISYCQNLIKLPEWLQDLKSLQKLEIEGCPKLTRRCQREIGEDWLKIAHVPEITLDGKKIKSMDN